MLPRLAFLPHCSFLVFAVPLLGEQVSIRQWFMVFLGFCGMLLIASPTGHHFGIGSIAAIGSAVFGAMVSFGRVV